MSVTEAKFWKNYLKPAIKKGFRVETSCQLGVPDVFCVLPSGRAVWIELKVCRSGDDLLSLLRQGQVVFREDYGEAIPCIVMGALTTLFTASVIVDIDNVRLTATGSDFKLLCAQAVQQIDEYLRLNWRGSKRNAKYRSPSSIKSPRVSATRAKKQPDDRPKSRRGRVKKTPDNPVAR